MLYCYPLYYFFISKGFGFRDGGANYVCIETFIENTVPKKRKKCDFMQIHLNWEKISRAIFKIVNGYI